MPTILEYLKKKILITRISISVSRKWSLPNYENVEFHQSFSATILGGDIEEASEQLHKEAVRMVEDRGRAYRKKVYDERERGW